MFTQAANACFFFLIYKKKVSQFKPYVQLYKTSGMSWPQRHTYIRVYHMHAFEIALRATLKPCIEKSDTTFRNIGAQPEHYLTNRKKQKKKNNASHTQL